MARVTERPSREALKRAAEFIAGCVRAKSPTAESAASFRVFRRGESFFISSSDEGTIQSERNGRHPVFAQGPRNRWTWVDQNKFHPERTHFMEQAAEEAADAAAEAFADAWVEGIVVESKVLEQER